MSTSPASAPAVDPQNPWLGLASFTEETRAFFHGRDEEVAELGRRVQRKLLTVLFGQSGLGKTSILRAGIVPRLRPEGYCPVYVRLDYGKDSPPPAEQIKQAIVRATKEAGVWTQPGVSQAGESLWEFLHHRDDILRDRTGRTLMPLLIFDQFEEIFTLAQGDDFGRQRAALFIEELADLVENRAPRALEAKLEADEASMEKFDFTRADYRLLIALREDYLAHLEGLKAQMPSVTQNRMRLARMTGAQALAAVTRPGRGLVNEEVAAQIVTFVSGAADLAHAEVEPSLLSLVCRELNETRRARGHAEISAGLLAGSRDTILSEFYERTLADQPAGVRAFIEDELLTDSGYRESIAEERVKKGFVGAGATAASLATLVDRRLLRVEERLDVRRVELTHDVLCAVVRASRDVRHERESKAAIARQLAETQAKAAVARTALNRARLVLAVCVVLTLAAVYGFWEASKAKARAERLATIADQSRANAVTAQKDAVATRQLAETSRGEAEKLVGFLLDDFYDELAPTGRLEIVGQLAQKAVAYYDALPAALRTPATDRNRAMALMRQGYVVQSQGDNEMGPKLFGRAIADFEKLRAQGDNGEETLTGLALALSARANFALFQGRSGFGAEEMRRAVELLRPAAAAAGSSRRTRREFVNILNWYSHQLPREQGIALCEEALKILNELGAADLSDLSAASAYGDVADSAARHALRIGRLDLAARLERESDALAVRILDKRPGDLRAMLDRCWAPNVLGLVEARRFHADEALAFAHQFERAIDHYLLFNPSDGVGWMMCVESRQQTAEALRLQGRIKDAGDKWREVVALRAETKGGAAAWVNLPFAWQNLAFLAAQRGDRAAADVALREAAQVQAAIDLELKAQEFGRLTAQENLEGAARRVRLALGEFEEVQRRANEAIERVNRLRQRPEFTPGWKESFEAFCQFAWSDAARAALHLGRNAEAEQAVRAALAAPPGDGYFTSLPTAHAQAHAMLALAQARQGQNAAALSAVESALKVYRELRAQRGDSVDLRHDFAYALYVQAVALAGDETAREKRRGALDEAWTLVDGLSGEAKALLDQRELMDWIRAERTK